MTLAIIESNSGGITSPSATPVSTRTPGPVGRANSVDAPRRRGEVAVGVLGVEPGLDRVAELGRRLALEPPAPSDVQLQLHEVEPGGELGDRVLDLQPGVDLEEGEEPLGRLVEELDGAGVRVAGERAQALGGGPQLALLLGPSSTVERDSSITFWLRRWMLQSRTPSGPHGAVAVGDDLHLDVAGVARPAAP